MFLSPVDALVKQLFWHGVMWAAPQSQGPVSSSTSKDAVELSVLRPGPLQPWLLQSPAPKAAGCGQAHGSRLSCLSRGGTSVHLTNAIFRVDVTLHIAP